jgi:hypothetical protein
MPGTKPISKKRIPFSQNDLESIDEQICKQSKRSNRSEQFGGTKKTAFDMVQSGTNLLDMPSGLIDNTVKDAQFLYSTQLFNDVLMKSLSTTQQQVPIDDIEYAYAKLIKGESLRGEP